MTALQLIGVLLLALPFVVVGIFMARDVGRQGVAALFGPTAVTVAIVILGAYLLVGS